MKAFNSVDEYGAVARFFHWATAFIILSLIPVGLYMTGLPGGTDKLEIYLLHKSFGLLVLLLVIGRIAWRFVSLPPDSLDTHAWWERRLAQLAHLFLYFAMIAMPLSGWLMSSAGEYPVAFFGIPMPDLMGKSEATAALMQDVHNTIAFILVGVLGLHIAGALKHHFIDKDSTVMRMSFLRGGTGAYALGIVALLFFAVTGYLMLGQDKKDGVRPMLSAADIKAGEADISALGPHGWAIVPAASSIAFQSSMGGAPFTGEFGNFEGEIVFNPDDLENSYAKIVVDVTSATTHNQERDSQIGGEEWFHTAMWKKAYFETLAIEQAADHYLAVGNLTIRDTTLPVTLPFTLSFDQNKEGLRAVQMKGSLEINRQDFGLGTGQSGETVGPAVKVDITVGAVRP